MSFLLHGSLLLAFTWLVVGGLGFPLPEDLAILATGVLVHRDVVTLWLALPVVLAGTLIGDLLLFHLARRLGPRAFERPLFARLLPPERRARIGELYERHGSRMIFIARHLAGLRGAVFAMAGIHGMPLRRFLAWDALAACISVPLTFTLGYLGSAHIDRVRAGMDRIEHWIALAAALAALGFLAYRHRHRLLARAERHDLQQGDDGPGNHRNVMKAGPGATVGSG